MSTILFETVSTECVWKSVHSIVRYISLSIMINQVKLVSTILLDTVSIDVFGSLSIPLVDISLSQL